MKILLADDHVLFRSGLRYLLAEVKEGAAIHEAGSGEEVILALQAGRFDLLLIDMLMPGMSDCSVIIEAKARQADLPIVVVSMLDDPAVIRSALAAGASGFIPKSSTPEIMTEAIRLVLAGGLYLPPSMLAGSAAPARDEEPVPAASETHLTRQQRAVLGELALGKSNKEIAYSLAISEATVKVHLAAIMRTLKVRNRTQAVLAAKENKLLP
jgi:DNA-binding NarL/FixJ family response regulator